MIGDGLDAWQRALLWRIYQGETSFNPPADRRDKEAECREYNFLVECLISLRDRGFIAYKKLHVLESRSIGPCRYLSAIVDGLSYQGEIVARSLDPVPAVPALSTLLSVEGLRQCRRDFDRAAGNVVSDPEQAIASALALLESVCKSILERANMEQPADKSIQPLMKATLAFLDLAPGSEAEGDVRGALKGLGSIAQQLGSIRTKSSAAHGRVPGHECLEARHARLAVNAAATVGMFLLETALIQRLRS